MSKSKDEPDGFAAPDVDESRGIDLEPGESYVGEITDCNLSAGDHGVVVIDGEDVWLNGTLRAHIEAALIKGIEVCYHKKEEEESFTNDDDEEVTYNPREFRFREDDD